MRDLTPGYSEHRKGQARQRDLEVGRLEKIAPDGFGAKRIVAYDNEGTPTAVEIDQRRFLALRRVAPDDVTDRLVAEPRKFIHDTQRRLKFGLASLHQLGAKELPNLVGAQYQLFEIACLGQYASALPWLCQIITQGVAQCAQVR